MYMHAEVIDLSVGLNMPKIDFFIYTKNLLKIFREIPDIAVNPPEWLRLYASYK